MKRFLSLLLFIVIAVSAKAQAQLSKVQGRTKDGKSVKVEYYHGALEDYIETIKYQLVDELQAKVKNLQDDTKDLQKKLDAANKKIVQLQKQLEQDIESNDNENSEDEQLRKDYIQATATISSLEGTIDDLQSRIKNLETEKASLDSTINELTGEIAALENAEPEAPQRASVIGFTIGSGPVFLSGLNNQWFRDTKMSTQFTAYYGTPSLLKTFPLSIEAGIDYRHFTMMAHRSAGIDNRTGWGEFPIKHDVTYTYTMLTERLNLNYIGIPIRLCFGQPVKGGSSFYAKIGFTPSFCAASSFNGQGKYSKSGYFPEWGLTLEDIPALGFVNDEECYQDIEPTINGFILWGNLSLGTCVPIGDTRWQFNAGIAIDYPFMSIGEAVQTDALPDGGGLLNKGGKGLFPSINFGLVYTL